MEQLTSFDEKYFTSHWVFWLHISLSCLVWAQFEMLLRSPLKLYLQSFWEESSEKQTVFICSVWSRCFWNLICDVFFPVGVQDLALEQGFVGKRSWGGFICGSYSRWRAAWSIVYAVSVCVCVWESAEETRRKRQLPANAPLETHPLHRRPSPDSHVTSLSS